MPIPLDYESRESRKPNWQPPQAERGDVSLPRATPRDVTRVVPAEFNALLIQTADHAALQAIEAVLSRQSIDTARDITDARGAVGTEVGLYVKAADLERSAAVRDEVSKRRAKFAAYPRQSIDGAGDPRRTSHPSTIDF